MDMLTVAMFIAAAQQSTSGFEVIAWVFGVVVAIGALFGALAAIVSSIRRTWKWFWKTFVPWIRRAVSLVNTLADIPDTLTAMDVRTTGIEQQVKALVTLSDDIRYELKNNGGGSTKDAVDRVEAGVAGIYAHMGVEPDNGMDLHQTESQEETKHD
jgi:hypothetical protein